MKVHRCSLSWFIIVSVVAFEAHAGAQSLHSECQLRVATGKKGKGFSKLFHDMQTQCGSQVHLCEVESEGGLQNTVALSANDADLGFVQIDTLQQMRQSDENIASLQAVLPINANLLHILMLRAGYTVVGERSWSSAFLRLDKTVIVRKLSDLRGLPVAAVGSAQLLGRLIAKTYNVGLRFVDSGSDEQAIAALKAGEVAAVLSMSGWPSSTVGSLDRDSGIALASFDLPVQPPYQLLHKNYPKLGVFNLAFLAAPNLLVTRPFKPDGERGGYVRTLQRCLTSNLDALREGPFEPAWKELKDPEESYGWPRFGAGLL